MSNSGELWTLDDIMLELGMTRKGARDWLGRMGVTSVEPSCPGLKPRYEADRVRAARLDQQRRARSRKDIWRWPDRQPTRTGT